MCSDTQNNSQRVPFEKLQGHKFQPNTISIKLKRCFFCHRHRIELYTKYYTVVAVVAVVVVVAVVGVAEYLTSGKFAVKAKFNTNTAHTLRMQMQTNR